MIKINNKLILSYNHRPKIIAEISGNHNGSKSLCIKHILSAKKNGADLVKIQTYEPQDITFNNVKKYFQLKKGIWKNLDLWNLYKKACTPYKWHKDLFKIARDNNIEIFSTPFSLRAVDFLEKQNVKLYKIASCEITDLSLVDRIGQTKKPVIMSTGLASLNEIQRAYKVIKKYHNNIIILHCVSAYPTPIEEANIERIDFLKKSFKNNLIGLSDHTDNILSSLTASAKRIVVIEKHFKLKNIISVDSEFSINESELSQLRSDTEKIFLSLKSKRNKNSDKENILMRRSIYAQNTIKKGEIISSKNIITLRPKLGICSSKYFNILGKKAKKDIPAWSPIKPKML
tara:strand:+ start:16687 stop:17718 length:1032 start_codon:yes stop_codon:yes gene_type:complete